jgi:hypothetical protein
LSSLVVVTHADPIMQTKQTFTALCAMLAISLLLSCAEDTQAPAVTPHSVIPKVGSKFTIDRTSGTYSQEILAEVTSVGGEEPGHKNISFYHYSSNHDAVKIAYEDNGDVTMTWRYGWLPLPVASQQTVVIPEFRREEGAGRYSLISETIRPAEDNTISVLGVVYACKKFVVESSEKNYMQDGTLVSTLIDETEILWSMDAGFPLYMAWGRNIVHESERVAQFELK